MKTRYANIRIGKKPLYERGKYGKTIEKDTDNCFYRLNFLACKRGIKFSHSRSGSKLIPETIMTSFISIEIHDRNQTKPNTHITLYTFVSEKEHKNNVYGLSDYSNLSI